MLEQECVRSPSPEEEEVAESVCDELTFNSLHLQWGSKGESRIKFLKKVPVVPPGAPEVGLGSLLSYTPTLSVTPGS